MRDLQAVISRVCGTGDNIKQVIKPNNMYTQSRAGVRHSLMKCSSKPLLVLSALLMNSSHMELEVEFRVSSSSSLPLNTPSRRALLLLPSNTWQGRDVKKQKKNKKRHERADETVHKIFPGLKSPPLPHFEQVVIGQPEVARPQLDAFAGLRLDGVDALVVVAVVTGVVGREQHPLHASHGRAAFS